MSSEIATTIRERVVRRTTSDVRRTTSDVRRQRRIVAVQLLGPLTMLGGVVWALIQPYRIAFLYPDGKGFYDYIAQPPLLVVVVGLAFLLLIAPGLVEDLVEREEYGSET